MRQEGCDSQETDGVICQPSVRPEDNSSGTHFHRKSLAFAKAARERERESARGRGREAEREGKKERERETDRKRRREGEGQREMETRQEIHEASNGMIISLYQVSPCILTSLFLPFFFSFLSFSIFLSRTVASL